MKLNYYVLDMHNAAQWMLHVFLLKLTFRNSVVGVEFLNSV